VHIKKVVREVYPERSQRKSLHPCKTRKMNIINYIKESFDELNTKVTWISWEEAQKSTVVVAVFSTIFALLIFGIDKLFQLGLGEYFKLF
jgi:preprotein translocase subunit SecE